MKPPTYSQPNLAQQGKGVSEAVAPKGNPNQDLFPNFHCWRVKYGETHAKKGSLYTSAQDAANATGHTLEGNLIASAKHVKEDRTQELASLGIPVKGVYYV